MDELLPKTEIDMSDKTYTLHINAAQARVISTACEVLARLGMGQCRDALEHLPLRDTFPPGWHEDMEAIAHILKKHTTINGVDYHGIGSPKTSEESKTAWDLYQVVRHRLAWDANPDGNPMRVDFDPPYKTGLQPLAFLEKTQ